MSFRCRSASYPETKIGEDLPESHGEGSLSFVCRKKAKQKIYIFFLLLKLFVDTVIILLGILVQPMIRYSTGHPPTASSRNVVQFDFAYT